jgi:hypothetical protein
MVQPLTSAVNRMMSRPNNSLERANPRALAALGRCGLPLSLGVRLASFCSGDLNEQEEVPSWQVVVLAASR